MPSRDYHKAKAEHQPTPPACEKALKNIEDYPPVKNAADVLVLFRKLTEHYPNALLHLSSFGSVEKDAVTLVSAFPIDVKREGDRLGVDFSHPAFGGVNLPEGYIADKLHLTIEMLNAQLVAVCQEHDLDVVKVSKLIYKNCKRLREATGTV